MNKNDLLGAVIEQLNQELQALIDSALEAKDAATNPESKAENKYDTRGLEASYLAGAQAERVSELKELIGNYQLLKIRQYDATTPIESTALIEVEVNGEQTQWLFLLPKRGGAKINFEDKKILTLSINSPLGTLLYHKKTGDEFEFKAAKELREYEILQVR